MSEFSRRDMLSAAAAGGMIAAATSTDGLAEGQPPFGPTPPVLAGTQLPSFRFRLGAVTPKSWNGGWAKEATVAEFPVSEKLAGVLMSLAPGGLARAALARQCGGMGLRDQGPMPRHHHRPAGSLADRRLRRRRRLVLPARVRPLDPGHRRRGLPVRARVRQWLFLRVRHLQHQRLGRAHAARGAGEEFRRAGVDLRQFPETRGLYRQGTGAAAASRRSRARNAQSRTAHPSLSPAGAASRHLSRRHESAGVAARVSDLDHHHRRAHAHQAGRHARAALASQCRRMAVLYRRPRPHERVRIARPRAHWRNSTPATSATCRRATGITSRTPAARISSC